MLSSVLGSTKFQPVCFINRFNLYVKLKKKANNLRKYAIHSIQMNQGQQQYNSVLV